MGPGDYLTKRNEAEDASKSNDEHEADEFAKVWLEHALRQDGWRVLVQVGSVGRVRAISLQVGGPVHTQQE